MSETTDDLNIQNNTTGVSNDISNSEKYLIFTIFDKLYCFPSRFIGEIALFETVYPLPLMPPYVPGVVNRYSIPYALFDIGLLFFNTPSPRKKVLIVKDEIDRIAFLIDDIAGIADIPVNNIMTMERSESSSDLSETVSASFKWNNNDVFVLDIHRILSRVSGDIV
jgi:purine-binding chemotaxis protein CheW